MKKQPFSKWDNKMKSVYYLVSLVLIVIFGCSTTEVSIKKESETVKIIPKFVNEVNLDVEKNVSWINLMPGTIPKFHVSGKISLLKGENYDNKKTQ